MPETIYISYATPDYVPRLKNLYHSLIKVGIPKGRIDFSTLDLKGNWFARVKQKPKFLYTKSLEYSSPDTNLCWIDSDAEVVKFPKFFEDFKSDWGMAFEYNRDGSIHGWLSNAFIVNVNDLVKEYLKKWDMFTMSVHSRTPTQAAFKQCWNAYGSSCGFEITPVPTAYVWYQPHSKRPPYNRVKPVIIHDIASRKTIRNSK